MRLTLDLSRSRVETKFRVAAEDVPALLKRIPADSREEYGVSTLYFDRADGSLARKALEDPLNCTKVRAREYQDGSPWIWFEVKTREGRWTRKSRVKLSRSDTARLISGAARWEPFAAPPEDGADENDARRLLEEARLGGLVPVGAVYAFRKSLTLTKELVRITLDLEISYHRPSLLPCEALGMEMLGPLLRREAEPILELKHVGCVPRSCTDLLEGLRRSTYSKFRTLVQSLSAPDEEADRVDRL